MEERPDTTAMIERWEKFNVRAMICSVDFCTTVCVAVVQNGSPAQQSWEPAKKTVGGGGMETRITFPVAKSLCNKW